MRNLSGGRALAACAALAMVCLVGAARAEGAGEAAQAEQKRKVRVVDTTIARGELGTVSVRLDAQGDEIAMTFTLTFDTGSLRCQRALKGGHAQDFRLTLNDRQAAEGRLGVVLDSDAPFAAGEREILKVCFQAKEGQGAAEARVGFAGRPPTAQSIADALAKELKADWVAGTVKVTPAGGP
jgi:hypothetical protein